METEILKTTIGINSMLTAIKVANVQRNDLWINIIAVGIIITRENETEKTETMEFLEGINTAVVIEENLKPIITVNLVIQNPVMRDNVGKREMKMTTIMLEREAKIIARAPWIICWTAQEKFIQSPFRMLVITGQR